MNSILRLVLAVNRVLPANPQLCYESIATTLDSLVDSPADIILFPQLAFSSPSCGNLFSNQALLESCMEQLDHLRIASRDLAAYLIVGLPVWDNGQVVAACAVLYQGKLLGYVADSAHLSTAESELFLPPDTLFQCGDLRFSILPCNPLELPLKAVPLAQNGCDLILCPSYEPVTAGSIARAEEGVRVLSRTLGRAVAVCNGGVGDTSSPWLYRGYAFAYECGEKLGGFVSQYESELCQCDLDADVIRTQKAYARSKKPAFTVGAQGGKRGLLRPVRPDPYLPEDPAAADAYLDELFSMQTASLAARLQNTGLSRMVVGVSGGLDSTLALLVSAAAADALDLPRENVVAVTMPGFGTSDRTYFNALSLIEHLGATGRDISIKAAVLQHFEDIGHDPAKKNTTYENAQARERAQILLDLANAVGGLVVGTGDLSEEALGWSTFAGDHISNYNVNVCITKTMIRRMVDYIARAELLGDAAEVLRDILDTPVSPELLPPDAAGNIQQKTEDILGPYALHDFFLYYLVKYGFRPSKLYYYACVAFSGRLDPAYIREKLIFFLRRLALGQFKRSCAPDSAVLTDVSLNNAVFYLPSDLNISALLEDIPASLDAAQS